MPDSCSCGTKRKRPASMSAFEIKVQYAASTQSVPSKYSRQPRDVEQSIQNDSSSPSASEKWKSDHVKTNGVSSVPVTCESTATGARLACSTVTRIVLLTEALSFVTRSVEVAVISSS